MSYFLNAVAEFKGRLVLFVTLSSNYTVYIYSYYCIGCPQIVRSDYGNENCYIATCQIAFHDNDPRAFRYGKSTTNTVSISIST